MAIQILWRELTGNMVMPMWTWNLKVDWGHNKGLEMAFHYNMYTYIMYQYYRSIRHDNLTICYPHVYKSFAQCSGTTALINLPMLNHMEHAQNGISSTGRKVFSCWNSSPGHKNKAKIVLKSSTREDQGLKSNMVVTKLVVPKFWYITVSRKDQQPWYALWEESILNNFRLLMYVKTKLCNLSFDIVYKSKVIGQWWSEGGPQPTALAGSWLNHSSECPLWTDILRVQFIVLGWLAASSVPKDCTPFISTLIWN